MTIICIVGSHILTPAQENDARQIIKEILDNCKCNDVVISGGAKGVDSIAEEVANEEGLGFVVFKPMIERWDAYRHRNWSMAYACDNLYRIVTKDSKTYGSGWTRDRAKEMGKFTKEYVV